MELKWASHKLQLTQHCSPQLLMDCSSSPGCSWSGICGLSLLQTSSTAAPQLVHGCTGRSVPWGAHGIQGDVLLLHGPLLSGRELLLCAWSSSCTNLHAKKTVSPRFSVFPKSALPENNQHCSGFSSGSGWSILKQLQEALIWCGTVLDFAHRVTPAAPLLSKHSHIKFNTLSYCINSSNFVFL